jgi:putative redox protein
MDTLSVKMHTIDDKAKLSATAGNYPELIIDYSPPVGTEAGYNSMELLMISFGSCLGTTVVDLLRRKRKKTVTGMSVAVEGIPRSGVPKSLESMTVDLRLKSPDVSDADARQAIAESEERVCPIWAMVKGNVTVNVNVTIE